MPKVSVIIPCFNHGRFLDEAVTSVLAQTYQDYEIIIVNDGSTDIATNRLLKNYSREKTRSITTDNQGLASARNNGIVASAGKYILPLDADDKISSTYMEKAVQLLEQDPGLGIVYCKARLFGAVETDWDLPDYSIDRMVVDNIIFCSAFFRRADWESVGGYDPGMIYGWEDYEFWLGLIERGRSVYRIPETLFAYRVASDSMVRSKEKWQKVEMFKRVYLRHQAFYTKYIDVWIDALLDSRESYFTSRLYVDCGAGISDNSSVARKTEQGTRRIIFDLQPFSDITELRFDPVDTWAVLEIDKVMATYRSGKTLDMVIAGSNALYDSGGLLFFDTRDPQCFFSEPGPEELSELVEIAVDLKFIGLAEQALEQIVAFQKEQLTTLVPEGLSTRIKHAGKSLLHSFSGSPK